MDRRTHPRFSISCPVRFCVDVMGSQFLVAEFLSGGTVLDISRSGMLAQVDRLFAVGTDCAMSLVRASGLVWPHELRGHVRRSNIGNAGWIIGVEFEDLIDVLPKLSRLPAPG